MTHYFISSQCCSKIKVIQNLQYCCQYFRCNVLLPWRHLSVCIAPNSPYSWGSFFNKNSSSHLQKFPVVNGISFSTISGKEDTFADCSALRIFLTRNECSVLFLPQTLRHFWLNGLYFGNLSLYSFSENFPKNNSIFFTLTSKPLESCTLWTCISFCCVNKFCKFLNDCLLQIR